MTNETKNRRDEEQMKDRWDEDSMRSHDMRADESRRRSDKRAFKNIQIAISTRLKCQSRGKFSKKQSKDAANRRTTGEKR